MKYRLIVNPISGSYRRHRPCFEDNIAKLGAECEVAYTEYPGHARELAAKAVEGGVEVVVAVGGDGTVNEVASALAGTGTALSIVPYGSGNGLAYHLGITALNAFEVMREGHIVQMDTGLVNCHPFFCTTGVGYDAQVARDYALSGHRGLVTYTRTALRDWLSYKPNRYKLVVDGESEELDALLITVGNADQWGNRFHITPGASLTDGLLDITIVKPISALQAIPMPFQLLGRSIVRNPNVLSRRGRNITISSEGLTVAHFDGESFACEGTVAVEVAERRLKVIAGSSADIHFPRKVFGF